MAPNFISIMEEEEYCSYDLEGKEGKFQGSRDEEGEVRMDNDRGIAKGFYGPNGPDNEFSWREIT